MDTLNTRLLKQLIRVLERIERRITAPLQQHEDATSKQNQSAEHHNEQQRRIKIRSELRLPISVREYYEAEHRERQSLWRKVKTGLEIIGVVVAVILAGLAFGTLKSAQQQVGVMRMQLEASDRPWVQITSAEVTGSGLTLYPGRPGFKNGWPIGTVSVKFVVKNVGRSVAVHVRMTGRLIFELAANLLDERQREVCEAGDPIHTTAEFTLFPDQDSGDRLTGQLGTGAGSEPINPQSILTVSGGALMTNPLFAGCITYQMGGSTKPHHTGFLYTFATKLPDGIARPDRLFYIGKRIPADRLVLMEDPGGFSSVD